MFQDKVQSMRFLGHFSKPNSKNWINKNLIQTLSANVESMVIMLEKKHKDEFDVKN